MQPSPWIWIIIMQPPFNFVMKSRITTNDTNPEVTSIKDNFKKK